MANTLFLASDGLGGLPGILEDPPAITQLLYIPTAANVEEFAPHAAHTLAEMGFQIDELDLAIASPERVAQAVAAADVIYVGGGNTYYLLDHINRSGFREALAQRNDVVYVGASAGSLVACEDIAFIGEEADSPTLAPDLESTKGLGLIDFYVLPHTDHEFFAPIIKKIAAALPDGADVVSLRDDQALVVRDGQREIVDSPMPTS